MTHYNDLPQQQKDILHGLKDYLLSEVPHRFSVEGLLFNAGFLEVYLAGSFAHGTAVTGTTYANSDLDVVMVLDKPGIMSEHVYLPGYSPEEVTSLEMIRHNEKTIKRIMQNFARKDLHKQFPDLIYAANVSIVGCDGILDYQPLGISLIDGTHYASPAEFSQKHGL